MKIAILGHGKMGKLVEQVSRARQHQIHFISKSDMNPRGIVEGIAGADVAIDFSHPSCLEAHINACCQTGVNLILGTTGWDGKLDQVKRDILASDIGCLASPNFSQGVYLFTQIVKHAAKLLNCYEGYDIAGCEWHHNQKIDAPSGTAKRLSMTANEQLPPNLELSFSSVRCGRMPGTHSIYLDSLNDTITLTHQAHERHGFVNGAIDAAEWLQGKKGFYTFDDFMSEVSHV